MKPTKVTVVSVAYASAEALPGLLACMPESCALVLVDNGPDDGARQMALSWGGQVIVAEENLGFGRACNLGARLAETEFLLFLNPDARLPSESLGRLLEAASRHPEAAAFGPVFQSEDGTISYKRRSYLDPGSEKAPKDPGQDDRDVACLSGAALMVRRSDFDAVGGFDPAIFLYYEDDDISARLRASGRRLVLVPAARATHLSGKSSVPSEALSKFKGYHWARSRIYLARKYGLTMPWLSGFRNAVWQVVGPRAWRAPERRAEGLGRLKGALSMLSEGRKTGASH